MEARTHRADQVLERPILKRILVPTDLTPIADVAFEFALQLARRAGADIDLLTVLGPIEGDAYSPVQYSPEASVRHETAEKLLRGEMENLVERHRTNDVNVSVSTRKGRPIPTIVSRAEQFDADLLIVGTHERGRLQHFLIGSAAEDIVRQAPCSVLVVHEQDTRPPTHIERLLVPVDLSDYSLGIVHYALALAGYYGARLDVLHVVEPIPLLDTLAGAMTVRDMVPDMRRRTVAELKKLLGTVNFEETPHEIHVVEGQAAAQILEEAARQRSDLIVIGKQGRSAIERFLMGSVTERVVRHAPCPVLVAHVAAVES